ncbi:hypothetical protein EIN_291310 [Entamoeba invadens IP1]|uniref:Pre-mRNA-splicing factor CWC26 n=1 Tax=Entamoeba invadens IP1 TaxID=370355 RepID=A0A0A1UAH9_ENTIV|nr:hypothetical protein EIN_291310 [Entamoeba invadens IP1]ELP92032.1 hypothetical protein EIN_291310 [Entamoeba invadens IP1]|eukprot:XP_004258803.1 hypothetical protein EIN_291310 [Entamoeba invadens IP1]
MSERDEAKKPHKDTQEDERQKILRSKTRFGDPMAKLFKRRKEKEESAKINENQPEKSQKSDANGETKSTRPIFKGKFPQNRFGIPPDYKWDGIDRGNGYEKKYFAAMNKKQSAESSVYSKEVSDW